MKIVLSLVLAVLVSLSPMLNVVGLGTTLAAAQGPSRGTITVPVTTSQGPGSLAITRFANQDGQLVAIGTLTLLIGGVVNIVPVIVPVDLSPGATTATCEILHLVLGPLDLNLLGLMVHLNQVVLDISAQSGPGNLLGNLLCAIANLLNHQNPLGGLAALLNQLLGQLG